MEKEEAILEVATAFDIAVKEDNFSANRQLLAANINELILHDFQKLVFILYRVDIQEAKLKSLLKQNPENAGLMIADLLIERQIEKIKSRRQFSQRDNNIDENDKW